MDAKAIIVGALQIAIVATVFGYGLKSTREDLLYLVRRPALLVRSFLAMLVVMPVLVVVLVKTLDLPHATEVLLVALSISPVPPLLVGREAKAGGRESFGVALMVVLAVLSIATMPLTVLMLERVFGRSFAVSPMAVAKIVVMLVVVPIVAGVLVSRWLPSVGATLAKPLRWVANGLLLAGTLALLVGSTGAIWAAVGHGTALALAAFVVVGLVVGHMLAGREPGNAPVLAFATACRHPGIALTAAAASFPEERFAGTLILYILIGIVVCVPYMIWQKKRSQQSAG